jgi:hypothetical protein
VLGPLLALGLDGADLLPDDLSWYSFAASDARRKPPWQMEIAHVLFS